MFQKLPSLITHNPSLITSKGFAVIPLIILALVGITAGTFLVQNGVNFMPKAVQNSDTSVTPYIVYPADKEAISGYAPAVAQALKEVQNFYKTKSGTSFQFKDPIIVKTTEDYQTLRCGGDSNCLNNPRALNDSGNRVFEACNKATGQTPANTVKLIFCAGAGGYASGANNKTFADAMLGDWVLEPISGIKNNWGIYCKPDDNSATYCTKNAALGSIAHELGHAFGLEHPDKDPKRDASVMMNHTAYPIVGFLPQEIEILRTSPFLSIVGAAPAGAAAGGKPEVQAKKCDESVAKTCPTPNKGCFIIDDKPRCAFEKISCTQTETTFCQTPPDPREGCEVAEAVIVEGQNKTPIQYTRCTAAKKSTPGAPTAPTTGTSTSPSTGDPSSTATTLVTSKEKINVTDCPNKDHKDFCFSTGNAHGIPTGECYTIRGEPKCRYSASIKECNKADKDFCVSRGGCVLETVPTNKGDIQFSRCADAKTAPNADGKAGSPAGGSTGSPTASAGCEDAKDEDGLTIPCYKIGVFSPEELAATQESARTALARYELYKKLLSEVKSDVNAEITAKAEEKIKLAEEKAQACLK